MQPFNPGARAWAGAERACHRVMRGRETRQWRVSPKNARPVAGLVACASVEAVPRLGTGQIRLIYGGPSSKQIPCPFLPCALDGAGRAPQL